MQNTLAATENVLALTQDALGTNESLITIIKESLVAKDGVAANAVAAKEPMLFLHLLSTDAATLTGTDTTALDAENYLIVTVGEQTCAPIPMPEEGSYFCLIHGINMNLFHITADGIELVNASADHNCLALGEITLPIVRRGAVKHEKYTFPYPTACVGGGANFVLPRNSRLTTSPDGGKLEKTEVFCPFSSLVRRIAMSPIAARKKTIIWMIAAIVLAVSSIALGAGLIVSHNSLTDTRNQLTDTQSALSSTQSTLADTENSLSAAKDTLASTEATLADTQTTLDTTAAALTDTQTTLASTEATLAETQTALNSRDTTLASTKDTLMITQTKLAAVKDTLSTTQNELDTLKASLPAKE